MGDIRSAPGLIDKLPKAAQVLADAAYDSDKFREFLIARGSTPVIKPNPTRKKIPPFDKPSYKGRNVIERAFSHLKDWRRIATRYDKLARNFRDTVTLALLFRWWTYSPVGNIGDRGAWKNDWTNRGMRLIAASCASILSRSFSPRRNGARATPVRFMWLHSNSSGFSSGA